MFDYRNNLKRILNNTAGDDKSLQNSLNAIKVVLGMTGEAESTSVNNKMDDKVIAQINTFLQGITTLIERPGDKNAKKIALGALHKLTFDHNIATNFGKKLGLLDQAIQASEETSTAVNRKIFEDAVKPKKEKNRDYRKGRRYTVIRALKGADLINNNGEVVFEVNERQIHDLNLKSGDIVEALPLANSLNKAEVLRVVGYRKLRGRDYDKIADFKYGVVQGSPGNLSVSRNIHGEKLVINHKPVIVALDSSYYQNGNIHLEDGAIVDLAWYTGDVRLKKIQQAQFRFAGFMKQSNLSEFLKQKKQRQR